jgi:hypothetical protein
MPKRSTLDWVLEVVSLAVLVSIFVNLAANWSELPDRVPHHYGFAGNPNAWGGKGYAWVVPIAAVGLYLLMTAASRYQGLINLPFTVDRKLPEVQKLLLSLSLFLKAAILLTFAYMSRAGINTALARAQGLGPMFAPISLAALLCPTIFFARKLWRYRT